MEYIIYVWLITLVTSSVFFTFIENKEKNQKLEYMIQIHEKSMDTVKTQSLRFGLRYKRKLVANILLFEGDLSPSDGVAVDIKGFKDFFADKVEHVEKRERGIVRYNTRQNNANEAEGIQFGAWTIQQKKKIEYGIKCWPYYGMAVQEAWSLGYTGLGVTVAVVDIGVEVDHPDLYPNIARNLSYSFVNTNHSHVHPPRFRNYIETEEATSHGTKAAGLIAGVFGNKLCSSGIAFKSKVAALKVFIPVENPLTWILLGFPLSVKHIPSAMAHKPDDIDIYSCSFNLANKFQSPSTDMKSALKDGVTKGRKGKGNIYVISAGNRIGQVYDCNMEPLANSIFTITISGVGRNGSTPSYSIPCAATLASTYGEFKTLKGLGKLTTTTHDGKCGDFKGTSASTALASGIIALTLQANPNITWRDLQYIIVLTASHERLENTERRRINAAGLLYDSFFGFGLMDAAAMTVMAKSWKKVQPQKQNDIHGSQGKSRLTKEGVMLTQVQVDPCIIDEDCVRFLEHVKIKLRYTKRHEHFLDIILCSPQGTCSCLLSRKPSLRKHNNHHGWRNWNFTSVHFWGENPFGSWILFFNKSNTLIQQHFEVKSIVLTLFGTSSNPSEAFNYDTKNDTNEKRNSTMFNVMNDLNTNLQSETSDDDLEEHVETRNQDIISIIVSYFEIVLSMATVVDIIIIIILFLVCRYIR